MSKIPAINEIDANSPSQESTEVVVKATTVTPDINEIQETISASATIQEIDGTRKPTISEIYKIVNDGLFESTTNWWDYAYKLSQAQLNQDIISRLDNGVIGGGYSKGVDIITTTSNKVPSNTNVYSALKSDSLYPKKLNDEVINGIYDFLNGLTIGKPTAYTGGTWSVDQTGRTHLTTDYLYVRLKAIFETLQILNVDTIGGKLVISPAGSIKVAYVDRIRIDAPVFKHDENTDVWSISQVEDAEGNLVNETLNQEVYRCYFLGEQDGEEIDNKWKVGDQAQAKTFNVKKGTYRKVENSYLWRLVVNVSSDTVDIDGKKYHYVDLSQIDFDSGSDAPAPGDVLNQLGHRLNDTQRQTALVLNAVDNYAPSITLYAGVNYYTLLNKEYVEFGVYNGKAFFNVYGDMYIGDKGENPKTYIKYKNGKINIKANLEIGSSIGDKDLDQYIKENGGVDEETVNNLINNSQVIKDLQKQTDGAIETWFYEGVPTLDNLPAVDWNTSELKKIHIGDLYYDQTTGYAYRFTKYNDDVNPYRWNRIKDNDIVSALDAANRAQITADGKMKVFYGETKPTNYQVGDMWVNATLEGKFNNDIARAVADNKTSFNANDWVLASRYSEAIATIQKWTNEYETKFSNLVDEVKQQKDQSIVVWYYGYEPTIYNAPANTWNTDELRSEHIGDIFYDIKNNHSYRWTGTTWIQIKDADFDKAMKAAKAADDKAGAAGDLADSKRRIFYSDTTPTEPFDKGDLWIKRVGDKTETWVYNGTDWVKSDDKALNDFKNAINEELAGIKGQLDGKAETWYQVDDPSTDWTDKASHEGDIWYNTSNGTTNYWNGSAWEQMDIPKDVFDTIDGKSSIFVDSYVDAKAGTGVISKGYKERDLWIIPEDATVNGVKYYKGDMLTAVSKNTNFDETNWKKKVRYVGPTELNNAIDVVNEKINTINNITIPGINNKFNEFIEDGVLDSSEKARLTDLLNQASNEVAAVIDQVNNIITSKYLTNDNANKGKLEEANTVMKTAWTEYKNLINTLIDANTEITKVNIGEANTKYRNLQEKIKTVKQYLAICQADILSGMGTDITSYKYLKDALNQTTEINGGLVLTSAIQLKDVDKKVTAGMNGIVKGDKTSIAAWYGGPMVDRDTFTSEELETKVPGTDYAMSLLRHDGTGYLAGGNIHWNADGVLSGNFNSFILQGTSIATMFYYIRLFYLHTANPDNTDFNNIDYVTPMKTFSRLSVLPLGGIEGGNNLPTGLFIGDSTTGGSFQIGNIILRTKSGDPNILEIVSASSNKTAHLGVQGGVSAYGTYTPSTGGGSGLNASIKSYANIIAGNYTDSDLTTIPNAYSIKALYNAIQNIDVTGQLGNYLLKSDAASTYQPKGNYLTTHQSIYGLTIQKNGTNIGNYTPNSKSATINISVPTKVSQLTNDSGYTKNTGTVTSVGLLVPTGLAVTNSPITTKGVINIAFAEGYSIPTIVKQTSWDGAVSVKHTHTNKTVLDSISSSKVTNWDNVYNWYVLMTTDEETTDGIINKWNEVVDFLSNISQTNTLSGIIDGINKSISDEIARAKKAETTNATNIGTNKTNITTLQSYFNNGSAKKALQLTNARKLWGNSFNGLGDINGNIILPVESYISIGSIKLIYDATNKALKIDGNVYSTGGISAYGASDTTGSGGGLNGTIVPYSTAIASDPQNEGTKIASASSIYKLHSRISSIESNGATNISVSGSGNAITSVSKNGNSIAFTKGATFLTSHQSLANCVQTVTTTGSGNAVTAISKSGSTITVTKGATFLTSHQSLANYYTKSSVDSLLSGKSATSHTHSVKINGVTKTIAATGGTAVDLGTYLTSHQSLADYAKKSEIPTKVSQLTNDTGYTKNTGTVTSVGLLVPTGLAVTNSPITTKGVINIAFAEGYSIPTIVKQTSWDGAVSVKHTHTNKTVLDSISSSKVTNWDNVYNWYVLMTTDEETTDGIINKWNEVVDFLSNISQTNTLSGIIDGINKSISDEIARAKKAETTNATNIGTNKTNITTLQSYFNNGSAKKALQLTNARKLWGNSFNGLGDINGNIILPVESYISIGSIKLIYDATNKALKIDGNVYSTGGISAYGASDTTGSGGGLNGTIVPYSTAIASDPQNEGTKIASASSIYKLHSRISSIESNGATNISVSGSGNAITSVSKNGNSIAFTKGATFLTSHQSLANCVQTVTTTGSGNAVTAISKSGSTITVTKGATFLTSHQSLANYYTKSSVDSLLSGKSATSHTHSVKINGVTKTIAATGGTAVDLGTYLTSHQSLADYAKKSEIPTKVSQLTNDTGYITSSGSCAYATNADKVDGVHVTWAGELTSTTYLTAWEANGSALRAIKPANVTVGNSDKLDGIHANGLLTALSNSDKGISITVGGTTKSVSNISVNYASSAGNADTVDGEHASAFTRIVGRHSIGTSGTAPYNYIHLFRIANSLGFSTLDCEIDFRTRYHSAKLEIRIRTSHYPYNSGGTSISIIKKVVSGRTCNLWVLPTVQTSNYNYYDVYYESGSWNSGSYGITLKGNNGTLVFEHKGTNLTSLPDKVIPVSNNVATSATKLQTPRTIWGQSFDGTANVDGTLSEVGNIHFKVDASYDIGSNDTASRYIYTNWLGARSGRKLELGANNSGFGRGLCLDTNLNVGIGTNSPTYKLHVVGDIYSDGATINGTATINGDLSVNGLINNKGIVPTNYEVNNKGASCYVSADALCSGITAITDSIPVNNLSIVYTNNNGNSWVNYNISNDTKFKAYANVAGVDSLYLGGNVITGNTDAEKLAQIKKNELMFSFEIPNSCYSQVYFACVDMGQGVGVTCTVEYLNSKGVIVNTYIKHMAGWNQFNYINLSNGNMAVGVGNDDRRYIRFRFKHDQNTTALRNASINKIRIFAFTKYSFPTDRFMGHTGHIYNFDYNMNTYFPNSILAKGGVTAYQSSDIRLKTNITKLNCLNVIKSIGGTYEFDYIRDHKHSIGFIAQNVNNPLLKDIIAKDDNGYLKINYWNPKLISLAFGALTEIDDEVDKLKARVRELESEVEYLKNKAYALQ